MSTGPSGATSAAASGGATGPTGARATDAGNVAAMAMPPDAKSGFQVPSKSLHPKFERMPPELKLLKNWLLWVPIWNGAKWTKRPIQVSGFGASTTNSKHWASFGDVKQAYEQAVQCGSIELREKGKPMQKISVGGVGFVFTASRMSTGWSMPGWILTVWSRNRVTFRPSQWSE